MDFVRGLLNEQRKRLVGTLMQYLEENVYPIVDVGYEPSQAAAMKREIRSKVLSSVGQYHDSSLDMLKVTVSDGMEGNEEVLRILHLIHANLNGHVRA